MADEDTPEKEPTKKSKLPLIIGLVLALVGGGGFFAVYSGMLFGAESHEKEVEIEHPEKLPDPNSLPYI